MSFSIHVPTDRNTMQEMSVLSLAHVGDAVYELLVRTHLARQGAQKLSDQHKRTISFVSAPAQADALAGLLPELTEEERVVVRRGRNTRVHGYPSGCTIAQYHAATALEALFGYLWLSGQAQRVQALFAYVLEGRDAS